jgi:hypothetical protein
MPAQRKGSRSKRGANKAAEAAGADAMRAAGGRPTFPYTTRPGALRRFLSEVPTRPRPTRVDDQLLRSLNLSGGENRTILRVLKAIGLLSSSGEPTEQYAEFMDAERGPAVLGQLLRTTYAPLFQASHQPHREPDERLRNLFNIHSAGAKQTIDFQIQTFKALADHADFTAAPVTGASTRGTAGGATSGVTLPHTTGQSVPIHIDLHIHLPEGKTTRDYEYIIQDLARYIFGRTDIADRKPDA